ncbi:MAG: DedA family protein, partial [Burkholderiaceae bacterium]|nr:DedA family protein [Burkholderiaceae bacterium]
MVAIFVSTLPFFIMDFTLTESLSALFISAFIASTVFPGGSEVVLVGVLYQFPENLHLILWVATLGNTLGSMTSYVLGRLFPNKAESRAIEQIKKYGTVALVMAWVPLIGDALPFAAGWLRLSWWK